MPLPKGPQIKKKILELHEADPKKSNTDIAREVGCTSGTVYYHLRNKAKAPRSEKYLIVFKLREQGFSVKEIAQRTGLARSTIQYRLDSSKASQSKARMNGNIAHVSTNGTSEADAKAPTRGELIGFAWAEVERGIANISSRIKIDAAVLRRRLSELLADPSLR